MNTIGLKARKTAKPNEKDYAYKSREANRGAREKQRLFARSAAPVLWARAKAGRTVVVSAHIGPNVYGLALLLVVKQSLAKTH